MFLISYVISVIIVLPNPNKDDCLHVVMTHTIKVIYKRARDKLHQPWVYLDKTTGSMYCAHCTCMTGYIFYHSLINKKNHIYLL